MDLNLVNEEDKIIERRERERETTLSGNGPYSGAAETESCPFLCSHLQMLEEHSDHYAPMLQLSDFPHSSSVSSYLCLYASLLRLVRGDMRMTMVIRTKTPISVFTLGGP